MTLSILFFGALTAALLSAAKLRQIRVTGIGAFEAADHDTAEQAVALIGILVFCLALTVLFGGVWLGQ